VNHLQGKTGDHADLLRDLTDTELEEQVDWYRIMVSASTGRDQWGFTKLLSTASAVRSERHENETA